MPAWSRRLVWGLAAAAVFVSAVYTDLWLRARTACLTGDRYMEWSHDPAAKKAWFEKEYEEQKAGLDGELKDGKMTPAEHDQRVELAAFRRDQLVQESSLKMAYHWYKTAVELFSPPDTKYVRLARERMPEAKRLWEAELKREKIPYEDYMLE
ncbi:MAG: hypothetical protein KGL53_14405 [Elusimicrobia bacterium]|nr:hypothetical protein [Elusimicrobiota bacterium]